MSNKHEGFQNYINLPPLDRELDNLMHRTNKMVQQVFVNRTMRAGRHEMTNPYLLHRMLFDIYHDMEMVINGTHPSFQLWDYRVISYDDFQLGLIIELNNQILAVRTNFCNLVFSEN